MDALLGIIGTISGFVWGPYMLILLVGTGIYLTFGLKWKTVTKLGYAMKLLMQGRKKAEQKGEGEITPFQALMTALSATIGTGNIAGVATAIFLGGPGAVFWMWVTALFGMATKYGEAVLAVRYRETMPDGSFVGGPMYYIKNGLGQNWKWLGFFFALFAAVAAFGIGNMVQSNSVARAVERAFSIPYWVSGLVLAGLTFAVVIGGIKRIARVTEKLVPFMAIVYVAGALVIIIANIDKLGMAFGLIFSDAFTGTAAAGGFAGSAVAQAMRENRFDEIKGDERWNYTYSQRMRAYHFFDFEGNMKTVNQLASVVANLKKNPTSRSAQSRPKNSQMLLTPFFWAVATGPSAGSIPSTGTPCST